MGGRWETQEYRCGSTVEYQPNMHRLEILKPCPEDPTVTEEKRRQKVLFRKVEEAINKSECDDIYKAHMHRAISHLKP